MIPSKITADDRERAGGVPEELRKLNIRVYFTKLPVADYVLSQEVAVERKSTRDLVSSIYDSRLFAQAASISSSFAKPYLLVEGDSTEVKDLTKSLKSYYGAIANVTLAYGLRVIYTASVRETAFAIAELLGHAKAKPPSGIPSAAPPKSNSTPKQQVYMVSSMPGIGGKLARKLLTKYGTPRRVMSLTTGELAMTPGIGWRRAEKIKEILDTRFSRSPETRTQMRLEE